jgi:hypothetical protein
MQVAVLRDCRRRPRLEREAEERAGSRRVRDVRRLDRRAVHDEAADEIDRVGGKPLVVAEPAFDGAEDDCDDDGEHREDR